QSASEAKNAGRRLFEMLAVLLVFGAEVFEQVFVRNQGLPLRVRDELAVCLGIVDRHVDLEVANIGAPKPLDHVQMGAVRMAHAIEPAAIPESVTVHNQHIALPPADGIAHPSGVWILREWTVIKKDLAEHGVFLVKDDDEMRRLDDFIREGNRAGGRDARRLASRRRTEFPLAFDALFEQRHGPRLHRDIFRLEVRHNIYEIAGNHYIFDAL